MDSMTILRARPERRTTKIHRPEETLGYDAGYLFTVHTRPVEYLGDIYTLLARMSRDTRSYVVSGQLKEGLAYGREYPRIYRRFVLWHLRYFERLGVEPYLPFEVVDRQWVCVDLDAMDLSKWQDEFKTPWDAVPYIRAHLPLEFQKAGCVWQWSSSAGLGGKYKAHAWFWLDRPACCYGWKEYFRKWETCTIDLALYNPVQPHYVNDPLFEGVDDPFEFLPRLRVYEGWPVKVPDEVMTIAQWKARRAKEQQEREKKAAVYRFLRLSPSKDRYATGALFSACENIASAGVGARHNTILEESLSTYRFVLEGHLEESQWRREITRAAMDTLPSNRHDEIKRILDGAMEVAA